MNSNSQDAISDEKELNELLIKYPMKQIRKYLKKLTEQEFIELVADNFDNIYGNFTKGMEYWQQINMLLNSCRKTPERYRLLLELLHLIPPPAELAVPTPVLQQSPPDPVLDVDEDCIFTIEQIYGEQVGALLRILQDQVHKERSATQRRFSLWLASMAAAAETQPQVLKPEEWLFLVMDWQIRFILGAKMSKFLPLNFDELPPTESLAIHFFTKISQSIERQVITLAIYHKEAQQLEINDETVNKSLQSLEDLRTEIVQVSDFLERYSPMLPVPIHPLQNGEYLKTADQLSGLLKGLNVHIARRGSVSVGYSLEIERVYQKLDVFTSYYAEWLRSLAGSPSLAAGPTSSH